MATILILKRRIQAARNVSKTTRAMQMIAASKLKRAQDKVLSSRPYIEKLRTLSINISTKMEEKAMHPYMQQSTLTGKTLLIALSPDKGLCGGLITNLVREFLKFRDINQESLYITVGKKIENQVAKLKNEILASFVFGTTLSSFEMVYPITRLIDEYYLNQKVDSVKILSAHFTSIFTQVPKITTVLPITLLAEEITKESFHLFEPTPDEILPSLLKHYLEMTIYQQLLESYACEQASRMITMQNATNNALDIIEELRLEYNKSRQAKITSEILDITGATAFSSSYEYE